MNENGGGSEFGPPTEQITDKTEKKSEENLHTTVSRHLEDLNNVHGLVEISTDSQKIRDEEKAEAQRELDNPVVNSFIAQADDELAELDPKWQKNRNEFPSLANKGKNSRDTKTPHPDMTEIFPYFTDAKKDAVMHEADYEVRNKTIVEVIEKLRDEPESAGFNDLAQILRAEESDLEAKRSESSKLSPFKTEWLRLELHYVRSAAEALGIMQIGGKIKDDDSRAITLDEYLRNKLTLLEKGRDTISDPDLYDLAEKTIAVFEVFYDKTLNYEPANKTKKKPKN